MRKDNSPVDDISGLNEEIHPPGPIPSLVNDARHFQHLSRVPKVPMKITDGNYPTNERVLREVPFVGDNRRCRNLEKLLVALTEFLGEVWSITNTSRLSRVRLWFVRVGSEEPRPVNRGQRGSLGNEER